MSPELEAAWTSLVHALPDEAPSAAFAGNVMVRVAGLRRVRPARDLPRRVRLALVACFGLIGVSALVLPILVFAFPLSLGGVIDALAATVKVGAVWAGSGVAVWGFLAQVARTIYVVLATPPAAAFLAGFSLLSALGLRLLFELTHHDRRTANAAAR